jgi:hypothetical protein
VLSLLLLGQRPEKTILKEERFIVVHSFGDFSPWSLGTIALGMKQG